MASFLQGVQSKIGIPGRRVYDKKETTPKFGQMALKEKLQSIANYVGQLDRNQRLRRNTTYYLMALYYQGYQNIDMSPSGNAFDIFERDDFYVENQFRRHVDAVVNMLGKNEGEIIVRPASPSPQDIAKARVAGPVLDMMKANIGYDRLRDQKNLYKALFGNAFVFTDYVVDKKYGTVVSPKYEYRQTDDPEGGDPLMSKVAVGFTEQDRGSEISVVCSPLEVHVRPDIKGFENLPYLRWENRQDVELLNYVYPGLGITSGGAADSDMSQQYLEVLSNLSGNILGDASAFSRGTSQVQKALLARTWIQPCMFGGDKELLREFPDGVHVVTIDTTIVDYYAEDLHDRWTHEVLIPVPHSLLGDGLYDALLMQDQINELNSLLIQHMRYSTVGHKIYDANIIDPKDVVNAPKNGWVPGRPSMDKNIQQAVHEVNPTSLSQDVPSWLNLVKGAMQDMTSAYDPSQGKSIGANTPYSQSVFLSERAQSRWQGSLAYNRPSLVKFHTNLLKIAQENWSETRQRAVADNTGAWTFQQFAQADLTGDVDILLSNTDMIPRSRAEQIQGLQMLNELTPLIPAMPPKQKLRVEEILGLPPDSNPMNTQVSRAYRHIDRIKRGEAISPLPFVDDPMVQVPVFVDFLASEEGEDIANEDAQTFSNIYMFMANLIALSQNQPPTPGKEGAPQPGAAQNAPGQPKGQPGGQPGQPGGGPNPGGQAQSPAVAPPLPPSSANNQ